MPNLSSSPFHLRERLREKLEARLEAVPLFNVLLVAILLVLTGSRFIFAPGLSVELSEPESGVAATEVLSLPVTGNAMLGAETTAVLTVKSDTMFIFEGHIYESLEDIFSSKNPHGMTPEKRGTLLVKLDRAVSVQGLFKIAELARNAGFMSLQIAGESPSVYPQEVR